GGARLVGKHGFCCFYRFGGTLSCGLHRAPLRIVGHRERTRLSILLVTPTSPRRFRAPIWVGMAPTCSPNVVGTPVRDTVAPVPIARLVAPTVLMPTASTAVAHQLEWRCRAKLN